MRSAGELSPFLFGVTRKFLLRRGRNERRLVPLDEGNGVAAELPADDDAADVETLRAAIMQRCLRVIGRLWCWCDLDGRSYEEAFAIALGLCDWYCAVEVASGPAVFAGRKLKKQSLGCAV